jgi:lysophospholipase L1-like esterase
MLRPRSKTSSSGDRATKSSGRTKGRRSRSRSAPIQGTPSDRVVVAALGDSITEGSPGLPGWDVWAAEADPHLELRNCGIYGQRTDEIAARLDECARGAEVLIVQGGINDIAQGRDVESAARNLRAMVRRGKELGLRVALVDVLPWNNGWPDAEPKIRQLNALIAEIARAENVPLLPFHDTLEDLERPGRMREEWTSDGDHPSVDGYRRLAEVAFRLP